MDVSVSESSSILSWTAVKPLTGESPPTGGMGWEGWSSARFLDQKYQPIPARTRTRSTHQSQEVWPLFLTGADVSIEGVLLGVIWAVAAGVETLEVEETG